MLVLNTTSGAIVARVPAVGGCDDVFYDADAKRLYASGGQGGVTIVQQDGSDKYKIWAKCTPAKARTSFFVRANNPSSQPGKKAPSLPPFTYTQSNIKGFI